MWEMNKLLKQLIDVQSECLALRKGGATPPTCNSVRAPTTSGPQASEMAATFDEGYRQGQQDARAQSLTKDVRDELPLRRTVHFEGDFASVHSVRCGEEDERRMQRAQRRRERRTKRRRERRREQRQERRRATRVAYEGRSTAFHVAAPSNGRSTTADGGYRNRACQDVREQQARRHDGGQFERARRHDGGDDARVAGRQRDD
jgi:hypothetical protein